MGRLTARGGSISKAIAAFAVVVFFLSTCNISIVIATETAGPGETYLPGAEADRTLNEVAEETTRVWPVIEPEVHDKPDDPSTTQANDVDGNPMGDEDEITNVATAGEPEPPEEDLSIQSGIDTDGNPINGSDIANDSSTEDVDTATGPFDSLPDSDGDGVKDFEDDAPNTPPLDTDGDGIPDFLDPDIDGDGKPNYNDWDDDGDWIPDVFDTVPVPDNDLDGAPNDIDPDIDGDYILNAYDEDMDGDGLLNHEDPDMDGDGVINELDLDDNANGVPDIIDRERIPDEIYDMWPKGENYDPGMIIDVEEEVYPVI